MSEFVSYFCFQAEYGASEGPSSRNRITPDEAEQLGGRKLRSNKEAVVLDHTIVVRWDVDSEGNAMYFRIPRRAGVL